MRANIAEAPHKPCRCTSVYAERTNRFHVYAMRK
jgi:hypothetical protein